MIGLAPAYDRTKVGREFFFFIWGERFQRGCYHLSPVGFCTGSSSMLRCFFHLHVHLWAAPTNRNIVGLSRAMLDQSTGEWFQRGDYHLSPVGFCTGSMLQCFFPRHTHTHVYTRPKNGKWQKKKDLRYLPARLSPHFLLYCEVLYSFYWLRKSLKCNQRMELCS